MRGRLRSIGPSYEANLPATAPGGTDARIIGTAATSLQSMHLRVQGTSKAAVANSFLRTRLIDGPVSFDLRMKGRFCRKRRDRTCTVRNVYGIQAAS